MRDYTKIETWVSAELVEHGTLPDKDTVEREVARLSNGRQRVVMYTSLPRTNAYGRRQMLVLRPPGESKGAEVFFSDGTAEWFENWKETK